MLVHFIATTQLMLFRQPNANTKKQSLQFHTSPFKSPKLCSHDVQVHRLHVPTLRRDNPAHGVLREAGTSFIIVCILDFSVIVLLKWVKRLRLERSARSSVSTAMSVTSHVLDQVQYRPCTDDAP